VSSHSYGQLAKIDNTFDEVTFVSNGNLSVNQKSAIGLKKFQSKVAKNFWSSEKEDFQSTV
jgi:hypothetical protein